MAEYIIMESIMFGARMCLAGEKIDLPPDKATRDLVAKGSLKIAEDVKPGDVVPAPDLVAKREMVAFLQKREKTNPTPPPSTTSAKANRRMVS